MPQRVKTIAISIQRYEYAETSQIVHFLTEDFGRMVVLAKGAHRPKNSYQGCIDLLVRSKVRVTLVQGHELGTLTRREVEWAYPVLRRSLVRYRAARTMLSLLEETTPIGQGGGTLFRLFDRGLLALENAPEGRIPLLMLSFQVHLLSMLGLSPSLSQCVRCGRTIPRGRYVAAEGGAVCPECLRSPGEGQAVSGPVCRLLESLLRQRLADIPDPPVAVLGSARRILHRHLSYHLERPEPV